jgi:ABC-2 type transport system ATP-binding protein
VSHTGTYIIEATGLVHAYNGQRAVDGVELKIGKGEFFGMLGPNGAGKTTTINILSTLLMPQEGKVSIKGMDLQKDRASIRRIIGIVPQEIALYDDLSALDNLTFWGRLYNIPQEECELRAQKLLSLAGLETRQRDLLGKYSGGMKRRVNLAAALMHDPELLLMDEPTVGIDPQSRNHVFGMLQSLQSEGKTIIYTTHYMEEVERLCSRAAIIDHGKIIAEGSLDELKKISAGHAAVEVQLMEAQSLAGSIRLPEGVTLDEQDAFLTFRTTQPQHKLAAILEALTSAGGKVQRVEIRSPDLETVFLDLTGRKLRDG